ncbi:MAG: hypothetical protein EOL95_10320 [Bacteroidia bacterium]|nr:hypothetical protein [Bacteroidia bacterium]
MPEDYQALLGELGVQSADPVATDPVATTDPVTTDPTAMDPSVIPGTDPVNPEPVTDPAPADPATPTDPQPVVDPAVEAKNQAFAAMRVQNAKYQKAMSRIAQAMGASNEDEAIEKLIGASFDVQAKRENVDPVILRRLTDLEEKNQMLDTATKQQFIRDSFGAVQKQFNLDDKEVIAFAQKLTDQNVDIFNSNIPLSTLYLGLYHDTITSKKLEAEKQNWIKGQNEADKAPGVNPATGKPISKDKKEITTDADLDLILKTLK